MKNLLLYLSLFASTNAFSQFSELHVGDKVPELLWQHLSQQNEPALKRSVLRHRLLVLDFWSTNCTSCFAGFPKVDALQQQFKDQVQFVVITKDTKEKVDAAMAKLKKIKMPHVPSLVEDTVLSKMFYYQTVPHHVWIDSSGTIRGITPGYYTVAKNIQTLLDGGKPKLYEKREVKDSKPQKPWTENDNLVYFSYFTRRSPEHRGGGLGIDRDRVTNKIIGIHIDPTPVVELMKIAYSKKMSGGQFATNNRVIIEARNPGKYRLPKDPLVWDFWADENELGYYLKVPVENADNIFDFMQQDLLRVTGLTGSIEKRQVRCLVLSQVSPFASSTGSKMSRRFDEEQHLLKYENVPLQNLADALSLYLAYDLNTPVVIGKGISQNVDVQLRIKKGDVKGVNTQLKKYGLRLEEQYRDLDMLVIREAK